MTNDAPILPYQEENKEVGTDKLVRHEQHKISKHRSSSKHSGWGNTEFGMQCEVLDCPSV
jgi:hypothetical protein